MTPYQREILFELILTWTMGYPYGISRSAIHDLVDKLEVFIRELK